MSIVILNNIFSSQDLDHINKIISNSAFMIDNNLGRSRAINNLKTGLNPNILEKFSDIAKEIGGSSLSLDGLTAVTYNGLYGKPNLPPHFDGDHNDLIINMQVSSNTIWDLGLNSEIYRLEDNSALIFNPNKEVHWRTHKNFKDGEYVMMLFVRFYNKENPSDYSHLALSQDDPIFKNSRDFRDSYPQGS